MVERPAKTLAQQPRDFLGRWTELRNSIPETDPIMTADEYYMGSTWDKPAAPRDPESLYRFWTDPDLHIHPNAILNFIDMHDGLADTAHRLFLQAIGKHWANQKDNGARYKSQRPEVRQKAKAELAQVEKIADVAWYRENASRLNPNTAEIVFRSSKILWQAQLFYDEEDRQAVRKMKLVMPVKGNPVVTVEDIENRYHLVEQSGKPAVPEIGYIPSPLKNLGNRSGWDYPARYESQNFDEEW